MANQRQHEKAKQKKALQTKRRVAQRPPKPIAPGRNKRKAVAAALLNKLLPVDEYAFWVCHGVNMMISDYHQGVWEPLFPIYNEEPCPEPIAIAQGVLRHFEGVTTGTFQEQVQHVCIGWTVQPREVLATYIQEAQHRLAKSLMGEELTTSNRKKLFALKDGPEVAAMLKAPHQPIVWKMMAEIKDQMLARMN